MGIKSIRGIKNIFLLIMESITIHFGKNPDRGGRPPRDRRIAIV